MCNSSRNNKELVLSAPETQNLSMPDNNTFPVLCQFARSLFLLYWETLTQIVTWLADPLVLCIWIARSSFLVHTHQSFITLPQVVPSPSTALPSLFCTCRAAAADACSNTPFTLEPQCSARWTMDALARWTMQGLENLRSGSGAPWTGRHSCYSINHNQKT